MTKVCLLEGEGESGAVGGGGVINRARLRLRAPLPLQPYDLSPAVLASPGDAVERGLAFAWSLAKLVDT